MVNNNRIIEMLNRLTHCRPHVRASVKSQALAGIFLLVLSGCNQINEQTAMDKAKRLIEAQEYPAAIIELNRVLQVNAGNAEARFLLGQTYVLMEDGVSAEQELAKATQLGVLPDRTRLTVSQALLLQGRYEDALRMVSGEAQGAENLSAEAKSVKGLAHFGLGDLEAAKTWLKAALASDPKLVSAMEGMATIGLKQGNLESALQWVERTIEADPDNARAWQLKAGLLYKKREYAGAQEAIDTAIASAAKLRLSRRVLEARLQRARILAARDQREAARKDIDAVLERVPDSYAARFLSATLAFQAGKYELAQAELQLALQAKPSDPKVNLLLGATHFAQGEYRQAVEALEWFLEQQPENMQARKLLARSHLLLDESPQAMEVLGPMSAGSEEDPELLVLLGEAAAREQQFAVALRYYRRAMQTRPDDIGIRLRIAEIQLQAGEYDAAIQVLKALSAEGVARAQALLIAAQLGKGEIDAARASVADMLKRTPDSPAVLLLSGGVDAAAGDRAAAETQLRQAIDFDGKFVPAMIALGRVKLQGGELEAAEQWFRKAKAADPSNVDALIGIAQMAAARGETEKALAQVEQAREADETAVAPRIVLARYHLAKGESREALAILDELKSGARSPTVLALTGQAYEQAGEIDKALRTYKQLLRGNSESVSLLIRIAMLESRQSKHDVARQSLKRALEIDPDSMRANAALALIEARAGRPVEAVAIASEIQKMHPENPLGYSIAGDIEFDQRNYQTAARSYEEAYKRAPARELATKVARALESAGQHEAAVNKLQTWLQKNDEDSAVRLTLAVLYQRVGSTAHAIREYKQVLAQDPKNVVALNNLALLVYPDNPTEALDLARRADELRPGDPSIKDTYGWLLVESGRPEQGLAHLQEAAAALDHPSIRYHLAVAWLATGSPVQAKSELAAALASGIGFEGREKARRLLVKLDSEQLDESKQ